VRTSFDFVILDTPPALPVADAVILGPLADGLVICARAGVLTRDEAKLLRERIGLADLKIFGTVLNRYRSRQHRYGRRYQYYGSYEETGTSRTSHAA
jgi:Mrp family chromosome partitioning ATPase